MTLEARRSRRASGFSASEHEAVRVTALLFEYPREPIGLERIVLQDAVSVLVNAVYYRLRHRLGTWPRRAVLALLISQTLELFRVAFVRARDHVDLPAVGGHRAGHDERHSDAR